TGEPVLDVGAVVLDVLGRLLRQRFTRGDDRLVALAHLLRGEVGVRARAVPVALDRLRVERRRHTEVFGDAVEQPARDPQLVGDVERAERANLEFPLPRHDFGVDTGDRDARGQARVEVRLDDVAAVHLIRAHTAVIEALRRRETVGRETVRTPVFEERVLL